MVFRKRHGIYSPAAEMFPLSFFPILKNNFCYQKPSTALHPTAIKEKSDEGAEIRGSCIGQTGDVVARGRAQRKAECPSNTVL